MINELESEKKIGS